MSYPNLPPSLQVGVPSIDSDHQELVALLDRLIRNPDVLPGTEAFSEIFSQLGGQIGKHFEGEESFFRSCGMPQADIVEHVRAHDVILEQYSQLNEDMMFGTSPEVSETMQMVKNWIAVHILEHDLKIRHYAADRPAV